MSECQDWQRSEEGLLSTSTRMFSMNEIMAAVASAEKELGEETLRLTTSAPPLEMGLMNILTFR